MDYGYGREVGEMVDNETDETSLREELEELLAPLEGELTVEMLKAICMGQLRVIRSMREEISDLWGVIVRGSIGHDQPPTAGDWEWVRRVMDETDEREETEQGCGCVEEELEEFGGFHISEEELRLIFKMQYAVWRRWGTDEWAKWRWGTDATDLFGQVVHWLMRDSNEELFDEVWREISG